MKTLLSLALELTPWNASRGRAPGRERADDVNQTSLIFTGCPSGSSKAKRSLRARLAQHADALERGLLRGVEERPRASSRFISSK